MADSIRTKYPSTFCDQHSKASVLETVPPLPLPLEGSGGTGGRPQVLRSTCAGNAGAGSVGYHCPPSCEGYCLPLFPNLWGRGVPADRRGVLVLIGCVGSSLSQSSAPPDLRPWLRPGRSTTSLSGTSSVARHPGGSRAAPSVRGSSLHTLSRYPTNHTPSIRREGGSPRHFRGCGDGRVFPGRPLSLARAPRSPGKRSPALGGQEPHGRASQPELRGIV